MELGFLLDPLRLPNMSYRLSVELPVPLVLGRRPLRESRRRQWGRGRRQRPPVPVVAAVPVAVPAVMMVSSVIS